MKPMGEKKFRVHFFAQGCSWWLAEPPSSTSPVRICSVGPVCPSLCLVDKYPCGHSSWPGLSPKAAVVPCPLEGSCFSSGAPVLCCPGTTCLWGCFATRCPVRCDRDIPTSTSALNPARAFLLQQVPASFPGLWGESQPSLQGMCGCVCVQGPGAVSVLLSQRFGGGSKPSLALPKVSLLSLMASPQR